MRYWIAAAVALMLAVPTQTLAQDAHPRSGFWFNGGLGYATLGCDDCADREGGVNLVLGLGGTLNQNVLLGGEAHVWSKTEDNVTLTTSAYVATIRFYPSATGGFYLLGGLGGSVVEARSGDTSVQQEGAGAVLGLGYDIRMSESLSLTPYWYGVGMSNDDGTANFGEIGLSVNVH